MTRVVVLFWFLLGFSSAGNFCSNVLSVLLSKNLSRNASNNLIFLLSLSLEIKQGFISLEFPVGDKRNLSTGMRVQFVDNMATINLSSTQGSGFSTSPRYFPIKDTVIQPPSSSNPFTSWELNLTGLHSIYRRNEGLIIQLLKQYRSRAMAALFMPLRANDWSCISAFIGPL